MTKEHLINTGKWFAFLIFIASNFFFFMLNNSYLNLGLAILVALYSIYELFRQMTGEYMNQGFKIYILTFYLFAILCIALGVRSFLFGITRSVIISVILIIGNAALIIYSIHKMKHINK